LPRFISASPFRANKEAVGGKPNANGIEIRYYKIIYDLVGMDVNEEGHERLLAVPCARPARDRRRSEISTFQGWQRRGLPRHRTGTVERGAHVRLTATPSSCPRQASTLKRFTDEVERGAVGGMWHGVRELWATWRANA